MPIERAELEAIFNSPNNEIEDGRIKGYEERSQKADKSVDDLQKSISSKVRPSILEEASKSKSTLDMSSKNTKDEDEDITLDDFMGSEDLNFTEKDNNEDVEEEEIVEEPVKKVVEKAVEKKVDLKEFKPSSKRITFDFDESEEEEAATVVTQEVAVAVVQEVATIVDDEVESEDVSDEQHSDEVSNDNNESISQDAVSEYGEVCANFKYLEDPRYMEFYRQKLRAFNFLKMNVPAINYNKLRDQIKDLHVSVHMSGIVSLDLFNEKIQQVQAVRNRLTEIRSLCIQNYVPKKRIIKLLEDCLMKESSERSNDKRAGEIQIHMADMEYDMSLSEAFMKDVEQIMENVTSAHEALSRQITVLQERNREIQRGQEPYVDKSSEQYDSVLSTSVIDEDNEGEEKSLVSVSKKWKKMM